MGSCNLNSNWFGRPGRRPAGCAPALHYALVFVLRLRKIAEKRYLGNRKVQDLAFC